MPVIKRMKGKSINLLKIVKSLSSKPSLESFA